MDRKINRQISDGMVNEWKNEMMDRGINGKLIDRFTDIGQEDICLENLINE